MKNLFILFAFIFFSFIARSQQKIEVEISEKPMSKGQQMAIAVLIPEAKTSDVEPLWKNYINKRGIGERLGNIATSIGNVFKSEENKVDRDKLSVQKKGDEWYIRSIEETSISNHSLDVYARSSNLPEGCQFYAFFQYTDSIFINETNVDAERLQNMKIFIHDFAVEVYKSVVDDQIKAAKKVVAEEEKTLKKIESNSVKEEKAISRYEVDIQEYEADIRDVENDITRMDTIISGKKAAFSLLTKGTPEYDVAKGEIKDLSKAKSKSFSKIKSYKSKIKSKQGDIKSSNSKIAQNEVKVSLQQNVIKEKEQIVDDLEKKKEKIE